MTNRLVTNALGLNEGGVVAVVGCGGKTSLITRMAWENSSKKVLVAPTTKIYPMRGSGIMVYKTLKECEEHIALHGTQCMGIYNVETGKLEALPTGLLEYKAQGYDLVLLEADGSAGLPCKGWLESEPIVPHYCTHTIGVITWKAVGKPATTDWVLRMPQFLALTGLHAGGEITPDALLAMVCKKEGMFQKHRGKQILFVNAVETAKEEQAVREWICAGKSGGLSKMDRIVYGSLKQNCWNAWEGE